MESRRGLDLQQYGASQYDFRELIILLSPVPTKPPRDDLNPLGPALRSLAPSGLLRVPPAGHGLDGVCCLYRISQYSCSVRYVPSPPGLSCDALSCMVINSPAGVTGATYA